MTHREHIDPLDCPMCRERAVELAGEEFDRLEGRAWEFVIEDCRLLDLLNQASDPHQRADIVGYAAKALMRNCRRDYIAKYWANHVDEAAEKIRIETDAEIAEMIAEGER